MMFDDSTLLALMAAIISTHNPGSDVRVVAKESVDLARAILAEARDWKVTD